MIAITIEELINFKILPYNIYSEYGEKLFSAGETLTPGKLLQLKNMEKIFRDDKESLDIIPDDDDEDNSAVKEQLKKALEKSEPQKPQQVVEKSNETIEEPIDTSRKPVKKDSLESLFEEYAKNSQKKEKVIEVFDMNQSQMLKSNTVIDNVSLMSYEGPINKTSRIDPQNQIKIKAFFYETINNIHKRSMSETANLFLNIRDKILQDIIYQNDSLVYSSQIKLIGEYQKCHSLNVAILSGIIAKQMDLNETTISDIVLAGLLHDIGKTRLDSDLIAKQHHTLSKQDKKMLQLHTNIGYKMLSQEMKMPENIALIALEHHENNDGSGYPMGKSGDLISKESKIVHVCNYFDNLSFNRTPYLVKNSKDAVRTMLKLGTKFFMPEALYTFINMFSYNDTENFEDMVL